MSWQYRLNTHYITVYHNQQEIPRRLRRSRIRPSWGRTNMFRESMHALLICIDLVFVPFLCHSSRGAGAGDSSPGRVSQPLEHPQLSVLQAWSGPMLNKQTRSFNAGVWMISQGSAQRSWAGQPGFPGVVYQSCARHSWYAAGCREGFLRNAYGQLQVMRCAVRLQRPRRPYWKFLLQEIDRKNARQCSNEPEGWSLNPGLLQTVHIVVVFMRETWP